MSAAPATASVGARNEQILVRAQKFPVGIHARKPATGAIAFPPLERSFLLGMLGDGAQNIDRCQIAPTRA